MTVLCSPDPQLADRCIAFDGKLGVRPFAIGRAESDGVELVVADGHLSRRHASLMLVGQGPAVVIRDEGSRNGTFVNGERIDETVLTAPAIVRIGETLLEIGPVPDERLEDPELVGRSFEHQELVRAVHRAAASRLPTLLLGETGSGKEVTARRLHALSGRTGKYVTINTAAIPPSLVESYLFGHRKGAFTGAIADQDGVFQTAAGGTLFLDEIAELPPDHQPKLLRVLESWQMSPVGSTKVVSVDVRVVAATNADLIRRVGEQRFRKDLYARLAGLVIAVPPLRKRRADIPLLARRFLAEHGQGDRPWTAGAVERAVLHGWPMNVRELRTVMARVASQTTRGPLLARHLDAAIDSMGDVPETDPAATTPGRVAPSREELDGILRSLKGNMAKVAQHYGKDPKQIYRWCKRRGLRPQDYR